MKTTLFFKAVKETKGAIQLKEVKTDGKPTEKGKEAVGTLYVRKSFFTELPTELLVTVESAYSDV